MREILRDLVPGQDYAVQFQSVGSDAVSEWSPVYRFRTAGDVTAPAPITGLIWRATGSSFLGVWDAVTTDGDGGALKDFKDYEVTVTADSISKVFYVTQPTFELTLAMNADTFGSIAFTVQIDVRTRDQTGNRSSPVSATATEDTPPKPSTPVAIPYIGGVQVSWDGNPATGVRNELNLDHVEIHASKTSGFTPNSATLIGRFEGVFPDTQIQTFTNLDYGDAYYFKLVAINRFGRAGTPSDQATATPTRISGIDIEDGQIGVDQINFTAYDIGGANAYYPATTTARDAIANAKANDIAFVTGAGYATYRYNGSSWVSAPEVGVVQGSKILAGTVTSNAVGTNLLITAAANIADAVIDNAKITSLDGAKINAGTITAAAIGSNTIITNAANIQDAIITSAKISSLAADKITAGTINSTIILAGKFATAASGARREVNSIGFQAWDGSGNQTISLDGVSNLLTGTFQTSLSGRRIVVGASESLGEIDFYAPDGTRSFVRAFTESTGTESIQFGLNVTASPDSLWGRINYNHSVNGEYAIYKSGTHEFDFDAEQPNGINGFNIFQAYSRTGATSISRMAINVEDGFRVWDQAGIARFQIGTDGSISFWRSPGGNFTVAERAAGGSLSNRLQITDTDVWWTWPGVNSRLLIMAADSTTPSSRPDVSGRIQMVNHYNYGAQIRYLSSSTGASARVEINDAGGSGYCNLTAGTYTNGSSITSKSDVRKFAGDPLDIVRRSELTSFRRKGQMMLKGKRAPDGPIEHGFIAEHLPVEMVTVDENDVRIGVNMMSAVGFAFGGIQKVADSVDELTKRIEALEAKK